MIHPTATTGNPWYRETRIGSYTDRDGMAAITCNLLGPDGTYDEETDSWTGGVFDSTSLIITKYHDENGRTGFDPVTGSAIDLNGTGSESEGFDERGTSPEGLEIAKMDLSGTGFSISNFNPRLFSKMYDELATLYREGYTSIYADEEATEPTEEVTEASEATDSTEATVPTEAATDATEVATDPTSTTTETMEATEATDATSAVTSTTDSTSATSATSATSTATTSTTSTGKTSDSSTGKVATGDSVSVVALFGILMVAGGTIAVTCYRRKKYDL